MRRFYPAVALLVLALAANEAAASPLEIFGIGGRSPALAGSGLTLQGEFDSVYLNPAGLAAVDGKKLNLGGRLAVYGLELDGSNTDTDNASGNTISGAFRLPLGGVMTDRLAIGISIYVPHQALVRARAPFPGEPTHALLETRSHAVGIITGAGVKLSERWSAGLSVHILAALRGEIRVEGGAGGRVFSRSEQRVVTQFAPILGVRYEHDPRWTFAAVFRGESRSTYEVIVDSDLGPDAALMIPKLRIAGVAQFDPLTAAVEVAHRPLPALRLLVQAAYQRWSTYGLPTEPPLEGQSAPGPGFHDTVVPRVAAEYTPPILGGVARLRGGYAFLWSPAPEMSGPLSLLDSHRHLLSAGIGMAWKEWTVPFSVDAWAQYHHLMDRTHEKNPAEFDPSEPPTFPAVESGGRFVAAGLTLGVEL